MVANEGEVAILADDLDCFIRGLLQLNLNESSISTLNSLSRFINNPNHDTLYILKVGNDYQISGELTDLFDFEQIFMLIKSKGILNLSISLNNQLNIINIPKARNDSSNSETIEKLQSLIKFGLKSYFDLIINHDSNINSTSLAKTRKKFDDLSLSLQHLQQRIQIPDLLSTTHPKLLPVLQNPDNSLLFDQLVEDSIFLNELTTIVNNWIREIQMVTRLDHDPLDGDSIIDEIQFWKSLEFALLSINSQINSPEVKISIDLLTKAKRFHITLSFQNDTELNNKLIQAKLYNSILKDLPVEELNSLLYTETFFDDFESTINNFFNQFKNKFKNISNFPVQRSLKLIEISIVDFINKLVQILPNSLILSSPLASFLETYKQLNLQIFNTIDQNLKLIINILRELLRKRQEKFIVIKINHDLYDKLISRLTDLKLFLSNHYQLLSLLENFEDSSSFDQSRKLTDAYNKYILPINPLDLSVAGSTIWSMNEQKYNEVSQRSIKFVINKLNESFAKCVSFSEFLYVYNRLNLREKKSNDNFLLLISDEYKLKILASAENEVDKLIISNSDDSSISKAIKFFNSNQTLTFSEVIPITTILKRNQSLICRSEFYFSSLTKLLGDNWNKYSIGTRIESKLTNFTNKLNPLKLCQDWIESIHGKILQLEKNGFVVKIISTAKENEFDLILNFDSSLVDECHQIHELISLGYKVPTNTIINYGKVNKLYPFIVGLLQQIRILKHISTFQLISNGLNYAFLLEGQKQSLLKHLRALLSVEWLYLLQAVELNALVDDANRGDSLLEVLSMKTLNEFQEEVNKLYSQVTRLIKFNSNLSQLFLELRTSLYNKIDLKVIIDKINEEVAKLSTSIVDGTDQLEADINREIQDILLSKCGHQLLHLKSMISNHKALENSLEVSRPELGPLIEIIPEIRHSIVIQDQNFTIDPLFSDSRQKLLQSLSEILNIVELQNGVKINSKINRVLKFKLDSNSKCKALITNILQQIDILYEDGVKYLNKWKMIQNMWELDLESAGDLEKLGLSTTSDLSAWLIAANDILKSRSIFDNSETSKSFGKGFLKIDFLKVQSRVNMKFDNFQNKFFEKFGNKLQNEITSKIAILKEAKRFLNLRLDIDGNISNLVSNINDYIRYRMEIVNWNDNLAVYSKCQLLLQKLRFKFSSNWTYVEQFENLISAIRSLLSIKQKIIDTNEEKVSSRIKLEGERVSESLDSLLKDWRSRKQLPQNSRPTSAITTLSNYLKLVFNLIQSVDQIDNVSKLLNIPFSFDNDLFVVSKEIDDEKAIWSSINTLWDEFNMIQLCKWRDVQPKILRKQLDDLLSKSRSLPGNVRQYTAFDEIQSIVRSHLKNFAFLNNLKGGSMQSRHWNILLHQIGRSNLISEEMTLGDVWSLNFSLNDVTINEMILQANNEQTIEENLNKIFANWSNTTFELFNYSNKCRLIKNWDFLFEQCNADISTLSSMKSSPYFGHFEQQVTDLETKLNKLYILLDIWIELQQQWVYLDSIFGSNNNEIQNLLPIESARFNNVSYEFLDMLKRTYKFNLVIDTLSISNIQETANRILDGVIRVRKSLTDYLEKQRDLFPRFYFIGNEDLLEIIGSSVDIDRINRHFKKMFIGIASLDLSKESSSIVALISEEGERVELVRPVSLIKYSRLNEWLSQLEIEIKLTLANLTERALEKCNQFFEDTNEMTAFDMIDSFPSQVCSLSLQIVFTKFVEISIRQKDLSYLLDKFLKILHVLTTQIGGEITEVQRKKIENLIIESLHQRDIITTLLSTNNETELFYLWDIQQQFYFDDAATDPMQSVKVKHSNAEFVYGFEYLGMPEKLAYTPLVDKCYLAMTQALDQKLGGSPFGPAGTGKTETIKALANNLGKMVLVFCCDELFDYQSMGRIFLGLCKVGAWGCFDEFNRLDERILSAISSQIESIEYGLSHESQVIEISSKLTNVHPETGLFVTMNPGYSGRSELPENLKKLFRNFAMTNPESEKIAEVLFSSQGFIYSHELSRVIVPLFADLKKLSTKQPHYDFGLRALKTTLTRCGNLRRKTSIKDDDARISEHRIVLESINEAIAPKLILDDEVLLEKLRTQYFPNIPYETIVNNQFAAKIKNYANEKGLMVSDKWFKKISQLYAMQKSHHGIILVGESGSGKSTTWKLVLNSMSKVDGIENLSYIIDCKVMSKEKIYGSMDIITRDWVDGLFTSLLRRITTNLRGELSKRVWIVFDGDIDPEWAENLNSVLDDNKILTLPNGERLDLPPNVRILFEVDNLKYATPATVTRCGMIWFDTSIVSTNSLYFSLLHDLENQGIELTDEWTPNSIVLLSIQRDFTSNVKAGISSEILLLLFSEARKYNHIMDFSLIRAMNTLLALLKSYCRRLIIYSLTNKNMPPVDCIKYTKKVLKLSLFWGFAGDANLEDRTAFASFISRLPYFEDLEVGPNYFEYDVSLPDAEWMPWSRKIDVVDLEPNQVNSNTVVPTLDTVMHEFLIYSIINEHKPLLLCGPPGSGKTMTFLEALRKSSSLDVLSLNFSKETSPDSLMKSLKQYCSYRKTSSGVMLTPKINGKWVVVFCDEINLPKRDKFGTQRVISLIRQMVEHNGFWDSTEHHWVSLSNIQFVGACNSPNDPGRNALPNRFLRHASLIMVDYPGKTSLKQIYKSFNLAVMKFVPDLRGFADALTDAMIEVYLETKNKLTTDLQKHYVYSPRELTRWCRGLLEALKGSNSMELHSLIRLWFHEGLRLFYDRLSEDWERNWTKTLFKEKIMEFFPSIDCFKVTQEPILFSDWLSHNYKSVDEKELTQFVADRLRIFSEEETELDLVLYESFLDHALRIDRVLRQSQGHMILVGACTSGKSTLGKFVAWINGLKVVQLKVNKNYGIKDFDANLRSLLVRCAQGEKICFMIDESSIMETSFIERMNTLLANSEIPGLFEEEDFTNLMNLCLEQSQAQGLLLDSHAELYNWFSSQVSMNLHVIFNINDVKNSNRPRVISSPALFNRCVLSWMGDWSVHSLVDIASKLIEPLPIDLSNYIIPLAYKRFAMTSSNSLRDILVDIIVYIHCLETDYHPTFKFQKAPKNFMTFISQFIRIFNSKLFELEENQRHVSTGLDKLRETVIYVNELKLSLSQKQEVLKNKDKEAKIMLNKMLTEQNEAERKQEFSIATQQELEKQEREILERRAIVMKDLEEAEPAVIEAQRGVQNIKKQHLTEMRSMSNPPNAVKVTMESVCILLGYEVSSWRDVQLIVRRDDFIPNIVNFDCEQQLTSDLREYMENEYLKRPDYNFETVNRASKACGPLVQWVIAQLCYSKILQDIGPMRSEVQALEHRTKKARAQLIAIEQMIIELEESIENYKEDYSELIRDAERIKSEMRIVETKVNRSTKLIADLTTERGRWKESVEKFGNWRSKLVGDSLLVASMVVYGGVYDLKGRSLLSSTVKMKLKSANIAFDDATTLSNYLSRGSEISEWERHGLVNDELNVDNFITMKYADIPFVIDPSNSVVEVLVNMYKPKKVVVTSFLYEGFVKQLENALRFGGVIVIQDAEHYDPLLDTILRKEVQKNGGRSIITLGEQIVDFSPDFKLYLHTRDPKINLNPAVASRTTIVNFSITSGSLESKVLDLTLKEMKPDVEEKRKEIVSLRGEYHAQLTVLETNLLNSLTSCKGNILDDDMIIETLENLKIETSEIDFKLSNTVEVMEKVEEARLEYSKLSNHSSLLFTTIQDLNNLSRFYDFSLKKFVSILMSVLKGSKRSKDVLSLVKELYKETFAVVSPSLTYNHKIVFALCLVLIYNFAEIGQIFKDTFISIIFLITSGSNESSLLKILKTCCPNKSDDFFVNKKDISDIIEMKSNPTLHVLSPMILALFESDNKIDSIMDGFQQVTSYLSTGVGYYSSKYAMDYWLKDSHYDLDNIFLIASPEGVDPALKIEGFAESSKFVSVSMGSKEGIEIASKQLELASANGNWLLLQNIQMSPEWTKQLVKILENIDFNPQFKLFLTCNISSILPSGLINKSKVIMFENEPGLKTTMFETFKYIGNDKFNKMVDLQHAYFLLIWFHSIIIERMRYIPISFSKKYDINDSDFEVGVNVIDRVFQANKTKSFMNWEYLAYLIGEITYGSKIDHPKDLKYVVDLAKYYFSVNSYQAEFNLIKGDTKESLHCPKGDSTVDYDEWINQLPNEAPLNWIHLPMDSDLLIKQRQAKEIAKEVYSLIK